MFDKQSCTRKVPLRLWIAGTSIPIHTYLAPRTHIQSRSRIRSGRSYCTAFGSMMLREHLSPWEQESSAAATREHEEHDAGCLWSLRCSVEGLALRFLEGGTTSMTPKAHLRTHDDCWSVSSDCRDFPATEPRSAPFPPQGTGNPFSLLRGMIPVHRKTGGILWRRHTLKEVGCLPRSIPRR